MKQEARHVRLSGGKVQIGQRTITAHAPAFLARARPGIVVRLRVSRGGRLG